MDDFGQSFFFYLFLQALWLRNLGYQHPAIGEEDLIMISEGDVFISSDKVMEPLGNRDYRWQ